LLHYLFQIRILLTITKDPFFVCVVKFQ